MGQPVMPLLLGSNLYCHFECSTSAEFAGPVLRRLKSKVVEANTSRLRGYCPVLGGCTLALTAQP